MSMIVDDSQWRCSMMIYDNDDWDDTDNNNDDRVDDDALYYL